MSLNLHTMPTYNNEQTKNYLRCSQNKLRSKNKLALDDFKKKGFYDFSKLIKKKSFSIPN